MKSAPHILMIGLFVASPAWAGSGHEHPGHSMHAQTQATSLAEGEVRRVDRAQGRLTLRHGPIESLNMPPMTMVFRVQDPSLLEGLMPGDRVRFEVQRIDGAYTVTRLEKDL